MSLFPDKETDRKYHIRDPLRDVIGNADVHPDICAFFFED